MFTMIKPCLYFHCFFLSGEKYVMTVFGVLNFGDQGNTACVNIYMHVMSKTFLFSFVFYLLLLYSVHGDFFYINGTNYIVVMQSEEDNLLSAILTNKKCIFKWCAFFRFCKCFNVLSFVKMKLAYF